MANIIFAEQENARLHPPTLKMRQRLQSAPGMGMYMFSDVSCVLICINFIPPSPSSTRETFEISDDCQKLKHSSAIQSKGFWYRQQNNLNPCCQSTREETTEVTGWNELEYSV